MAYIIILLIVLGVLWFLCKKAKGFYKAHEFTIKYAVVSFWVVLLSGLFYDLHDIRDDDYYYEDNDGLNIGLVVSICIVVAVYVVIRLLYKSNTNRFYNDNKYTINLVFLCSSITMLLGTLTNSIIVTIILAIASAIICIYLRVTYESRVVDYISKYVYNICNEIDKKNLITEAHLFSQPEGKKLLNQGHRINDMSPLDFMRSILKSNVLNGIKKEFIEGLEEAENKDMGRIFFYYEYTYFLPYLEEQGIRLVDCIDSFGIINSEYWYIEDVAFFSDILLKDAISSVERLILETPELSDVLFSEEYYNNKMYHLEFLHPYLTEFDLNGLKNKPELFKDDIDELYFELSGLIIQMLVENNKINQLQDLTKMSDSDKSKNGNCLYSYNHEDENGIIKEEYGQQFEQNRVQIDDGISQEQMDELAGCPV